MYFNQSGSQALAQAGSGDLLTGIMTGILSMTKDVMTAVCMSVWLHGYLAEIGTEEHAIQNFPIEQFPEFMDKLFKKHGM
jgi:NAD(P)H-hydrate epimerase